MPKEKKGHKWASTVGVKDEIEQFRARLVFTAVLLPLLFILRTV